MATISFGEINANLSCHAALPELPGDRTFRTSLIISRVLCVCTPADPCPSHQPYPHRREERLAAAITRSRESRQQSYMRNRDEYVASAITSAFASDREREREAVGIRVSVSTLQSFDLTLLSNIVGACV